MLEGFFLQPGAFARGQISLSHLSFFQALSLCVLLFSFFLSSFFPFLTEPSLSGKQSAGSQKGLPVQALETEEAGSLLMETLDHWGGVGRHYSSARWGSVKVIPRLLAAFSITFRGVSFPSPFS